jgi:hypothetical protein
VNPLYRHQSHFGYCAGELDGVDDVAELDVRLGDAVARAGVVPNRRCGPVALDLHEADQLLNRLDRQHPVIIERQRRLVVAPAREDLPEGVAIGQDNVLVGAVSLLFRDGRPAEPVDHVLSVRLESSEPQLLVVREHLEVLLETSPSRLGGALVRYSHKKSLPLCQKNETAEQVAHVALLFGCFRPARQR